MNRTPILPPPLEADEDETEPMSREEIAAALAERSEWERAHGL